MNRAVGYCRVSTTMQAQDGVSLDTQKDVITRYCNFKNYEVIKFYVDEGISGKTVERPALQELLKEAKRGDILVVASLSRLSRNTKDALNLFEEFKQRGIIFVCRDPDIDFTTAVGELMFTILMAVHKLERETISKNVSINMQRLSKEGKLRSRPPFGYLFAGKDKDYEPCPKQMPVREKIIELYKGGMKVAHITKKLNEEGDNRVLNPSDPGKLFYQETIRRILCDAGLMEAKGSLSGRKAVDQRILSHHKTE